MQPKWMFVITFGFELGFGTSGVIHAQTKPKAYVVSEVEVTDPQAYREYASKFPATLAPFGADSAGRTR